MKIRFQNLHSCCRLAIPLLFLTFLQHIAIAQVVTENDTIGICTGYSNSINILSNDSGSDLELNELLIGPAYGLATFDSTGVITLFYADGEAFDPVDAIVYVAEDADGNLGIGVLTIYVSNSDECVWPGDANDNALVSQVDLLSIGLFYGDTGPVRFANSTEWSPQYSIDWEYPSFLALNDRKYTDCNGDGMIDMADIEVILQNYGEEHAFTTAIEGGEGFPPLGIAFFSDSIYAGAAISIPIYLGSADIPATNVYGLSFSLEYDKTLIVPGTMSVSFNTGWLAASPEELISLNYEDTSVGYIDAAVSRTNKVSVSGYGHIGEVSFVMEDNLAGRITDITDVFLLCPDNPTMTNSLGQLFFADAFDLVCDSVVVLQLTSGINDHLADNSFNMYPNPVTDALVITSETGQIIQYAVVNMYGQVIKNGMLDQNDSTIPVVDLNPGSYLLVIKNNASYIQSFPFIKL